MNLREAQREDVTQIIQAFCQLNDIVVDDLHMFVSVIKRDWPTLSIENLKAVIAYWHAGTVDIRKPRKFTLRFFGEIVSAWRNSNVTKNIVDSNRHSDAKPEFKQPLATVLTNAAKAWDIQYHDWCKMLHAGSKAPWRHVMCIDDKLCLIAGIYKENAFSKIEIARAQAQYLKGYKRIDEDAKHVRKAINIANVVKTSSVDMQRVGRLGAYYNSLIAKDVIQLIMPDSVVNVVTQQYNEVS